MNARGQVCVRSAADLVPVVAVTAGLEEARLAAARPDPFIAATLHVLDPARGDDLPAIGHAAIDQHLSERQQVVRPAGDAASGARRAFGVNGDEGIGGGAERLPQKPGAQIRETFAGDTLQHDTEHIRVG